MQYASGIQKTVTHGYSAEYGPEEYVQWPGFEGMDAVWSERFNKRQPAAVDYLAQNLHYSRLQKALEEGVPQMDLAILRTDYAFNNRLTNGGMINFVAKGVYSNRAHTQDAWYWRDMELQNAGYTYDYFSPYLLLNEEVSCTNGLINADGAAYQGLILMEEEMPLAAAEQILAWAKEGLPILFVNHTEEIVANDEVLKVNNGAAIRTGSNNSEDEALLSITEELKALPNVAEVESEEDAYEALQELGVRPRVEHSEANTCILPVLRRTEEADYMYLYHYMYEEEEDFSGQVSIEGSFVPYMLDQETLEGSSQILFRADSFEGGTAALWINGTQVPVNMDRCSADLTGYVKEGENTLEIRVSTSLRNKMLEVGYEQGWNILTPEIADYGMTGEAKLVFLR